MVATAFNDFKHNRFSSYSDKEREQITKMIMKLFDHWEVKTEIQLNLLGMKSSSRAILSKYRNGDGAIPNDVDKLNRAGLILLIHKNLRLLFPENPNIVYSWIKRKNKAFNNESPIELIEKYGLIGLAKVARYTQSELVK